MWDFRRIGQKESLIFLGILIVLFYVFANNIRDPLSDYIRSLGLLSKLFFYFLFTYGVSIIFFYLSTKDWQKTIQFAIIILFVFDLAFSMPVQYSKTGFGGMPSNLDIKFGTDSLIGEFLEKNIFNCTSYQLTGNEVACTQNQTLTVHNLLFIIIPSLFLLLLFAFDRRIINLVIRSRT